MRILIDLQGKQNNSRDRGIGRYSLALTKAIIRNAGSHQVYVLLNELFQDSIDALRAELYELIGDDRILIFSVPEDLAEMHEQNSWRTRAAELLRERLISDFAPDMLLICSLFEGGGDNTVSSVGHFDVKTPTAVVLYDLIPLFDPDHYLGRGILREWYFRKIDSVKRADVLLAISHSAAKEAIEELGSDPSRVVNISSAVDQSFQKLTESELTDNETLKRHGITRKYLMHTSALEPRKNFDGLVKAFAALPKHIRKSYQLVLVFKITKDSDAINHFRNLAKSEGLGGDELIITGYINDRDLITIYSMCHLFVFPSFHEGFGLPALEAMSCGAAVIGSDSSSIPEVIGRPDALFDPTSITSMRDLIQKVLTDEPFWLSLKEHSKLHSKNFSWDITAKTALVAMEKVHQAREIKADDDTGQHIHASLNKLSNKLSQIRSLVPAIDADYESVARSIYKNELRVNLLRAHADLGGKLTWRVEGPFDSTYSLALVNREAARAMHILGHEVVLHSTEGPGDFDPNPSFLEQNPDLAEMASRVKNYPQQKVHVASRNLYPPRVMDMHGSLNLLHHYAWEESGFPPEWVNNFNTYLDGITCVSKHVEKIMIDNGVTVPLVIIGNGVDHWERIVPSTDYRVTGKSFKFLHVSTCLPRKGPISLLDAYGHAFSSDDDVSLIVKTSKNEHNKIHEWIDERKQKNDKYPHVLVIEDDLSDSDLKALYMQCDVLVQPARAEGFGLPMAEAMLSGIPVITTGWSGQLEFCNDETSWLVDYHFTPAQTHFGLFFSAWAEVDVTALAQTMKVVLNTPLVKRKAKAAVGRKILLEEFKWIDCTAKAVIAAQTWQKNKDSMPVPKIGWITTWNTRCGIATYSNHLVESMPYQDDITIFAAPFDEPHPDDELGPKYHRSWIAGEKENKLKDVAELIQSSDLNTIIIQFNNSLFNFNDLGDFIDGQINAGKIVIVVMHSTTHARLLGDKLYSAFMKCQRILVHSVHDLNNLKAAGFINNVCLFPHGVLSFEQDSKNKVFAENKIPMVAAYGFCLPHKGLPELVQAIAVLKHQGTPVRLRLVNAEFPIPESANLVNELKELTENFGISDLVEFHNDFLEDEQSLALLSEANLLIFPYQETGESASGAVRYGLATKKPVAVTPLRIFDDLGDSVYHFSGTGYGSIANGIKTFLKEINLNTDHAKHVKNAADRWRAAHNYAAVSTLLYNINVALLRQQQSLERVYAASSPEFRVSSGVVQGRHAVTKGVGGFLLYGPYARLQKGRYVVKIKGEVAKLGNPPAFIDVVAKSGGQLLALGDFKLSTKYDVVSEVEFSARSLISDLEIRVHNSHDTELSIGEIEISPKQNLNETRKKRKAIHFTGSDVRIQGDVGVKKGLAVLTTGQAGVLCSYTFADVSDGHYLLRLYGDIRYMGHPTANIEVCIGNKLILNHLKVNSKGILFESKIDVKDIDSFDVQVNVFKASDLSLYQLELVPMPAPVGHVFMGADSRFGSQVGKKEAESTHTTNQAGYLMYGPYLSLQKGRYQVVVYGDILKLGDPTAFVDVTTHRGSNVLVAKPLLKQTQNGVVSEMIVETQEAVSDFEVRIWVPANADLSISKIEILPEGLFKEIAVQQAPSLRQVFKAFLQQKM